jgi:6-pyruvoyltetrahydropterin/6-carboxytetrahydropterin synthase
MTTMQITVKHEFAAGHRLQGIEGHCNRPHGHNYRVFVSIEGELDSQSMVIDFGDVKSRLGRWIDDHWDHAFILDSRDIKLRDALASVPEARVYILDQAKPTAEILAITLARICREELSLKIARVQVWETDRQYAEVSVGPHLSGSPADVNVKDQDR